MKIKRNRKNPDWIDGRISSPLNDYHKKRNEHALKVVEEMSKEPYSLEQMRDQVMQLSSQMDEDNDKKNP